MAAPEQKLLQDLDPLILNLVGRTISGKEFCAQNASRMDNLLRTLAHQNFTHTSGISLMALGGYGRMEQAPYSDIDLLFLVPAETDELLGAQIERFLYQMWDKGIKVGHAVRTVEESLTLALKDSKVLSTLLDARSLWGQMEAAKDLQHALRSRMTDADRQRFMKDKLAERDARRSRYGDTRYVLEPNIKEGKGGLRDFQTMLWITDVLYGAKNLEDLEQKGILTAYERARFAKSHDFLLNVRAHLHEIAGRAEERLHFDIQPDLAERLGYTSRQNGRAVERFMKHYFLTTREIGNFSRLVLAAIGQDQNAVEAPRPYLGFEVMDDRLVFGKAQPLEKNPIDMLRIFHTAQESSMGIHPFALRDIARNLKHINESLRSNPQANDIFITILTSRKNAAHMLRRMNESSVLGHFIPDFRRIVALMQFDRYHYFTVDEHILRCIDILHEMLDGKYRDEAPLSVRVVHRIGIHRALFVALFLHDICKGRGGGHAELGAELALTLGPRFGLSGEETDLVSWLVLDHLRMSDTAFRRNLNDPKTIADFSAHVRTTDRLDLLFVLTTADIMGVGPGRWTAWKARLLEELYMKTRALMMGEEPGMVEDATLPADLASGETRVVIQTDDAQSATVVMVYTPDRPGLFSTLCGALSAEGASIMRAYIATVDGPGRQDKTAVDRFVIQNASGLPFRQDRRQEDLRQSIIAALEGTLDIRARIETYRKPLSRKDRVFDIPPRIVLNNEASGSDTVLEIETRDRHGLLYDIATILKDQGLDIRAAKINTQGLRAIDSFYVQTAKRKKLVDAKGQARLVALLEQALASTPEKAG